MIVHDVQQGTAAWLDARRGLPTASEFSKICTPKTCKMGTGARSYMFELIAERNYCGQMDYKESYESAAMRNGMMLEPEARKWYEFDRGVKCEQVGFVTTDDGRWGWSPDALVGDDGALELKCPQAHTLLAWLDAGVLPPEHWPQCHAAFVVGDRKWIDFVAYHERLPSSLCIRVTPDEKTEALRSNLEQFSAELEDTIDRLNLPEPEKPDVITMDDVPAMLVQ